mmetsp:Transcript_13489/g.30618  ORF Transcript_13489/g.30618 Transcript_13489/m.30618 type:complete len:90 (+) Transcript_13489:110-379(+)
MPGLMSKLHSKNSNSTASSESLQSRMKERELCAQEMILLQQHKELSDQLRDQEMQIQKLQALKLKQERKAIEALLLEFEDIPEEEISLM